LLKEDRRRYAGQQEPNCCDACVSATDHTIPPYVIFDAKGINHNWMMGEVPGWVDTELFEGWLVKHLLKHAVAGIPLLLVHVGWPQHTLPT